MKIKQLTIYGYGKWVDKTFDIPSGFHVFLGENEAGKTTLMSFIHSILFGFPTRHSSKSRYEPKDSSRYGGKILMADDRFGNVSIERTYGKATGDVSVLFEDGTTGSEKLLRDLLYGLDLDIYRSLFSFQLKDLEEVKYLNKDKFHRFFLSTGALGSEKFLKQSDQFSKEANALYKPTGRIPEINQKLTLLEEKQSILNQAKDKNAHYLKMVNEVDEISKSIVELDKEQISLNIERESIDQVEKGWTITQDIRVLEEEVASLRIGDLPEDGLFELNRINQEIEKIRKTIHQVQEKIREYREEHQPSKMFIKYQENEKQIENVAHQLPQLMEKLREKKNIKKEVRRLEEKITKEKIHEEMRIDAVLPDKWSLKDEQLVENWIKQLNLREQQEAAINHELITISYKLSSHMERIDQLEENLWSSDTFKKETTFHETANKKTERKPNNNKETIAILFGCLLIVSTFFVNDNLVWLVGIGGILFFATGFLFLLKRKTARSNTSYKDHYSYEEFIQQKELRKQWRQQLASIDTLEGEKQNKSNEMEKIKTNIKQINDQWDTFKTHHYIPAAVQLGESFAKQERYQEMRKIEKEIDELEKKQIEINDMLESIIEPMKFLDEFFPMNGKIDRKIEVFNHFLQKMRDEKRHLKQYVSDSHKVEQDLNQLIRQEKNKLNEKQELLQSVDADSESIFRHFYEQLKVKEEKQEQIKLLKAKQNSEEVFQSFESLEDVQKEKQRLLIEKQKLLKKEKELTTKKIQLELEIKKLEEGGEYASLLQDFENEKSNLQVLVDEWASNKAAALLIEKTLNYSMEDRLPKTLKDAESYFAFLTNHAYKKIIVEQQSIRVLNKDGKYYEVNELSRGTAEPLYVALRLAFVKNMHDILKLPIIIDDGFVNFDKDRKERVYQLLKKVSLQTQVLYFSFDEEILDLTEQDQITMLQ